MGDRPDGLTSQEYSHAADASLDDRCINWGRCYVDRMRRSKPLPVYGHYRGRWAHSWDYDAVVGVAPDVRPSLDHLDAWAINCAWQSIPDAYHQAILGGHYVRRWAPVKCAQIARKIAGMNERERINDAEFERTVSMSLGLLERELYIPAVVRRARLSLRVRDALELDEWKVLDSQQSITA